MHKESITQVTKLILYHVFMPNFKVSIYKTKIVSQLIFCILMLAVVNNDLQTRYSLEIIIIIIIKQKL